MNFWRIVAAIWTMDITSAAAGFSWMRKGKIGRTVGEVAAIIFMQHNMSSKRKIVGQGLASGKGSVPQINNDLLPFLN